MANEATNKVVFGSEVLIDLTGDTVSADTLRPGITAHDKSGVQITGTYVPYSGPATFDYIPWYVMNGKWNYQNSTNNRSDIYEVEVGKTYIVILGGTVGTRFRAVTIDENPVGTTTDQTGVVVSDLTNPKPYQGALFTATKPYLAVTKDNASKSGVMTSLVEVTGIDLS